MDNKPSTCGHATCRRSHKELVHCDSENLNFFPRDSAIDKQEMDGLDEHVELDKLLTVPLKGFWKVSILVEIFQISSLD